MRRIELIEHAKALLGGYFWLPCPNCGRMFGGQESRSGSTLWDATNPSRFRLTCPDPVCRAEVARINRQRWPRPVKSKVKNVILFSTSWRIN